MTEAEVRGLCLKSREIFLQQPILLELEAPLKICGKFLQFFIDLFIPFSLSRCCPFIYLQFLLFFHILNFAVFFNFTIFSTTYKLLYSYSASFHFEIPPSLFYWFHRMLENLIMLLLRWLQATSMVSTQIYWGSLSMADSHLKRTTSFLVITLIVGSSHSKQFACCSPTKSSILKTSSCCEATTNVPLLIGFMDFMMNVSFA